MKASGSYESLMRGVSQQVPQNRRPGQHGEQVNMIPDPVRGLSRRWGSVWQAEREMAGLTLAKLPQYLVDTEGWHTLDFSYDGKDYALLRRTEARPAGSDLPPVIVYNKTDKVFLSYSRPVTDGPLNAFEAGGSSAATSIGRYVFLAGNTVLPTFTSNNVWSSTTNSEQSVVWIRGGAYSRTFVVKAKRAFDGQVATATYTTPASSYQGTLSTADIPASDPEYVKKVNDRVNAFNSAVTNWIGEAAEAITPANIAQELTTRLATALGALVPASAHSVARIGSHITLSGITELTVEDGGDGSLIRGVDNEISSVDQVSPVHYAGKVVKVKARRSEEALYLKAVPKVEGAGNFTDVTWVEGAGTVFTITRALIYGTVIGSVFHMASSASGLAALTGLTNVPTYEASTVGDEESSPVPYFLGRKITYLGVFQDRLLVGCGGVLRASKTGQYLNFFRTSVLTAPADDTIEVLSQGNEDDELRHSVLYDRDLVIFGKKRQYVVGGRQALTPTSANMVPMSSHADAADLPPIAVGGFIFYARRGERDSSAHQIQPGSNVESPESFSVSSQLDTYISGAATELATLAKPTTIFIRSSGNRQAVYVFSYLDAPDGRKQDAWGRWEFTPDLGPVIGMSSTPQGLLVFFLRYHSKAGGGNAFSVVADLCTMTTGLSERPYLDSLRPYTQVAAGGSVHPNTSGEWFAAYDGTTTKRFLGTTLSSVPSLPTSDTLWVGADMPAYFEPTNPFVRDREGNAVLTGRTVITTLLVTFRQSSGFVSQVISSVGTQEHVFNGRILGDPSNIIGQEPVTDFQQTVPIGRETREYRLKLAARKWLPFTVTAIEWVGQLFNRTQRF